MHKSGPQGRIEAALLLTDDPEAIRHSERQLLEAVQRHGHSEAASFAIRLAFEEAVYNAFRHGHKHLPGEPLDVRWAAGPDAVSITIQDRGPGFDPDSVPDPTASDRLELPHGRGIMLMRAFMTRVEFNEAGNRVTMVYEPPAAGES